MKRAIFSMNRKKKNCAWLMGSLVLMLILMPLVQYGRPGRLLMSLLATFTFLGGIGAVSDDPKSMRYAVALVIPPILIQWYTGVFQLDHSNIFLVPSFYHLPIYVFLAILILKYIFRSRTIGPDHLYGAISVYLLLGMFFANVYIVLETINPGSIHVTAAAANGSMELLAELYYFSFVTLTSLGYGDISPASVEARTVVVLQAVSGVLFVGALVARIAGSAVIHQPSTDSEG
jgi:hypothetical protein